MTSLPWFLNGGGGGIRIERFLVGRQVDRLLVDLAEGEALPCASPRGSCRGTAPPAAPGRMTAPDRLCPPQVLAFSTTATGTSPSALEQLGVVGQQLQQAVGARQAGGAAAHDRHADLDQLVLVVELALDELVRGVDRRRVRRRRRLCRCCRPSSLSRPSSPSLPRSASGRILFRSPTMPRSENSKIGAFGSLLIATMFSEALHADLVLDGARRCRPPGTASARPSCPSGRSARRRGTSRRRPPRGWPRRRRRAPRPAPRTCSKPSALPSPRPPATSRSASSMFTSAPRCSPRWTIVALVECSS